MSNQANYGQGNHFSDYDYNITSLPTSQSPQSGFSSQSAMNPLPNQFVYYPAGQENLPNRQRNGLTPGAHDSDVIYNSYAGVDIVATIVLPNEAPINLGELQTLSYSMHRENTPVRLLGHTSPAGFVKGARTIAGSMIFTVFNNYAFYRLRQFQNAINYGLYPVADMLPPFDMVLTFANESGILSKMKILGLTFIDEGGTMSIDDLIQEQTYQYMARGIQPLTGYFIPEESTISGNRAITSGGGNSFAQ